MRTTSRKALILSLFLAVASTLGCSSDDDSTAKSAGEGTATFTVYGEDYIEQSIPATEVEDGWTLDFDRFLVVLGPVTVADSEAGDGATLAATRLYDLTAPGPHEVGTTPQLTAGGWNRVGFELAPITAAAELHASANADNRTLMETGGYAVYVSGTAQRDTVTKTFAWGFTGGTHYTECVEVDASGTDVRTGIQITNGGVTDVQLTIHGDHFFYDDLTAENAVLRFDAIAAADDQGDANGEITLAELDAVQLVDIPTGSYGTGSASDVNTLGAFVHALVETLGHFQGEGHCHSHGH